MPTATEENAKELARREDRLFTAKVNLDALNQELAYNFYPERADFTVIRCLGTEFAIDLFDSAPVLDRRDLGNARAAMLRPRGQQWFRAAHPDDKINERPDVATFLDWVNKRARNAMYAQRTGFVRANKENDHDLVTFGNGVMTAESTLLPTGKRGLLMRDWHLRDCAWYDDADGIGQDVMFRRFNASARHIKRKFPDATLADPIVQAIDKEPDKEFKLCHVMMPADEYEYYNKPKRNSTWVSVYYDSEHQRILRERPSDRFRYIVSKWQTLSTFQYAVSPASIVALSDARGMQTMMRVLLEAGEKALDPPLKATQKAVKGEINNYAAGITWVDKDYDERLGPAIEPLLPKPPEPAVGIDLIMRTRQQLRDAWYLTKLTLPQQAKTAFETAQLVEEFIRANIPLFEPWESDTERMLTEVFGVLMDIGEFGPVADWPAALSGADLEFQFSNPLQDAIERNKVNQYQTALGLGAGAAKIDPTTVHAVDWHKGLRDAVRGAGSPSDWLPYDDTVAQNVAATNQAGNVVAGIQQADQAADIANKGLDAAAKLRDLNQPAADGSAVYGPT